MEQRTKRLNLTSLLPFSIGHHYNFNKINKYAFKKKLKFKIKKCLNIQE